MKLIYLIRGFLLTLMLFVTSQVMATHFKGVDITYECISGCTYRMYVTQYFDCSGIAPPTNISGTFTLTGAGGCTQPTAIGSWIQDAYADITPLCPGLPYTDCLSSPGGSTYPGVIIARYYRDYDFCSSSCVSYTASYTHCCRSGTVTNLVNPNALSASISVDFVPQGNCNQSPAFMDHSTIYVEGGQQTRVSLAAYDADGDSLAYWLIDCQSNLGSSAPYNTGYTSIQPLGPSWIVNFDSNTGDLVLAPNPGNIVESALCYEVKEYRDGNLIGTYQRDLSVLVLSSSGTGNHLPYIPHTGNTAPPPMGGAYIDSFIVQAFVGVPLHFRIDAFDLDAGDSTTMAWSQNLNGATFTDASNASVTDTIFGFMPQADFNWTAPVPGRYAFQVDVWDNSCYVTGNSEFGFVIDVDSCDVTVDIGPDTITVCSGNIVLIPSSVTGGTGPYTYQWSTGETTPSITVGSAGTYFCWVSDVYGCTATDTIVVDIIAPTAGLTISGSGPNAICQGDTGTFEILSTPSPVGVNFSFDFDDGTVISGSGMGPYQVTWTNPGPKSLYIYAEQGGCFDTLSISGFEVIDDCVWPGDADYDGVTNNLDLLALGLTYGSTGSPRLNPTLNWEAQVAFDWNDTIPGGINYKHSDTDGNGTVNDDDTLAININYGLTHNKTEEEEDNTGEPPLLILPVVDSANVGDTLNLPIYLGVDSIPAADVYGIAFTIGYDQTLVDSASAKISFSNGWLGMTGTDLLGLQKDFYNDGMLDVALTRIDQMSVSGYGQIASMSIVMIDDIAGKTTASEVLKFTITNVRVISNDGTIIPIDPQPTEITVVDNTTGLETLYNQGLSIYPNPASSSVRINSEYPGSIEATLYDLNGKLITSISSMTGEGTLELTNIPSGLYIISVNQEGRRMVKKLKVIH